MDIKEIEKLRKRAKRFAILGIILGVALGTFIGYILLINAYIEGIFIGIIVGFCAYYICSFRSKAVYKEQFKNKYVRSEFERRFENVQYDDKSGIPMKVIKSTHMINLGNSYTSNDLLKAEYKGIKFMQADICIRHKVYIDINDIPFRIRNKKLFMGRWFVFDFNKTFIANIQVRQKRFANAKLERVKSTDKKYEKINMENILFNKQFKVFAQSQHDAFYVLTPRMMERIQRLTGMINGKLLFCFVGNKLHIAFNNNKDSFEHGIWKKINERKVENEIFKDTTLIMQFIDELNLDNDLFRREV